MPCGCTRARPPAPAKLYPRPPHTRTIFFKPTATHKTHIVTDQQNTYLEKTMTQLSGAHAFRRFFRQF